MWNSMTFYWRRRSEGKRKTKECPRLSTFHRERGKNLLVFDNSHRTRGVRKEESFRARIASTTETLTGLKWEKEGGCRKAISLLKMIGGLGK